MRHPLPILATVILALTLAASPVRASGVGSYHEETLDNGLRVVYIRHAANPMVASSVIVGAGVVHEPDGMNGSSHFLEHLLFNGTERRSQRELYDAADRYGAYNNATTREDHTLFTLLVQKEFAEAGLDIQADMLFHSTLPADKFEKEKGIVLEELAKDENDPGYLAGAAFRSFAYAGTPLARPVLGSKESIGGLTRDRVYAYYKSRYVPANMILVVMGDFEIPEMKAAVRRTFGAATAGKVPAIAKVPWPPPPGKNLARRPVEAGRTYVHAAAPLPLAPFDPDLAAVELLVDALAGSDDAPLRRVLQSGSDPMALSASLAVCPGSQPYTTLEFEAVIPEGKSGEEVLAKLVEALRSPASMAAARERVGAVRVAARADEVLTADQIHYYALTRSSYLLGSPGGYLPRAGSRRLSRIGDDATRPRARRAPRLRVRPPIRDRRRRTPVGGDRMACPRAFPGGGRRGPRRPRAEARVGARRPARAQRRLAGVRGSPPGTVPLRLGAAGQGGDRGFPPPHAPARAASCSDRATLAARLDELGARVKTHDDPAVPYDDYYTTPEFSFVRLEMPADRWREGIALLGEIVRFPRMDPSEIEAVRKEMLDLIRRRSESTRARAQDLAARTLAAEHPLAKPVLGTAESVASITAEDLRAFHARYFTGRRLVLTEVGPVDGEQVLDGVRAALGALPAGDDPTPVPAASLTPAGVRGEEALGKEQASVALAYLFDADPADEAALLVTGALLSDKLSFRLREEKGLAYSMSASIAPWGGRERFDATMATRRTNVDEALARARNGDGGIRRFRSRPRRRRPGGHGPARAPAHAQADSDQPGVLRGARTHAGAPRRRRSDSTSAPARGDRRRRASGRQEVPGPDARRAHRRPLIGRCPWTPDPLESAASESTGAGVDDGARRDAGTSGEAVLLMRTWSDGEAALVRQFLDSYGIACRVVSDVVHSVLPLSVDGLGEIRILVAPDELDDARQILAEHPRDGLTILPGGREGADGDAPGDAGGGGATG